MSGVSCGKAWPGKRSWSKSSGWHSRQCRSNEIGLRNRPSWSGSWQTSQLREVGEFAILADQAVNQLAVGVVFGLEVHGVVETNAASVLPARNRVAGPLEIFDGALAPCLACGGGAAVSFVSDFSRKSGCPSSWSNRVTLFAKTSLAPVSRFQIGVAGDAVPVAGFGQHLGPFVFLMARRARDVSMGRSLIGVVLADAMAGHALFVVDRVRRWRKRPVVAAESTSCGNASIRSRTGDAAK